MTFLAVLRELLFEVAKIFCSVASRAGDCGADG